MRNRVGSTNFSLLGKEQIFFGSERAVKTSATPEAHKQGPCRQEHPNATSSFGISPSWLSSTGTVPGEVPRQCFKDSCLLQTLRFWRASGMSHSNDILRACFYSFTLIHLVMFVKWSKGPEKAPYQFDFLALSHLVARRFKKSVI